MPTAAMDAPTMATPRRRSAIEAGIARPTPTAAFGRKKICPTPRRPPRRMTRSGEAGAGGGVGSTGTLFHAKGVSALQRSQTAGTEGPMTSGISQAASRRYITIERPLTSTPPRTRETARLGPTAKKVAQARPRNQPFSSTSPVSRKVDDTPAPSAVTRAITLAIMPATASWGAATATTTTGASPTHASYTKNVWPIAARCRMTTRRARLRKSSNQRGGRPLAIDELVVAPLEGHGDRGANREMAVVTALRPRLEPASLGGIVDARLVGLGAH